MTKALTHDAVRHIKAEAYQMAGEDKKKFDDACIELAFDYPHYASSKEIAYAFQLRYNVVMTIVAALKESARFHRDQQYQKENNAQPTFRTVRRTHG